MDDCFEQLESSQLGNTVQLLCEVASWWAELTEAQRKATAELHHFTRPLGVGELRWAYKHQYLGNAGSPAAGKGGN